MRRFAFLCLLCVVFVCQSLPAHAGTITVCSSGCTYKDIQAAIDAARFGDTILLRAGETYVGHYKLRAKAGTGWITIRSDASASLLPAPGTRLVPSDRPGANTSLSLLPRLVGRGGQYRSAPLLRTDPGAHGYRIQYIDFDGVKNVGWESLMYLGEFGTAANAYDLELDHVYIHGHKYKGQKRAIALNSGKTSITDSYIADIKNVGFDTQAIACWNGTGPYTITNNHLEAAGENVMFGGTDPAVTNRVPADATFRRNLFTKPVAWRNEILSAPAGVTAAAQTGGALAAGTHYFKVVALMFTGPATAVSRPSAEVRATVSSGGKVTVSWSGVTGADKYRIYRGTAAGGEKVYIDTPGRATSFAYTGSGETAKTPAASGTMWTVKNIFELKNAERITLDGNILENIWAAAQFGYAIVLTPRNSNHTAPWVRVKDIVFTNNLVRHASGIANISAYDENSPSGRTTNVTFRNNVFQDIDRVRWGGNTMGFLIQNGPTGIVIDHNTNLAMSSAIVYAGGAGGTGFVYTNNVSRHNLYGIRGDSTASGLDTLARYFPGSTVTCNVLAGGKSSSYPYPVPNAFPTEAQFIASFVDYAAGNYELLPGSVVGSLRCGGTVAGVDFDAYNSARGIIPPLSSPETANATPTASAGGPYSSTPGVNFTVDGSASHDSDGTISAYRWSWGDQILVRAAGLPGTAIHGTEWIRLVDSTAAGGAALNNPDKGAARRSTAQATPASYVEFSVRVAAGTPYQLWMRMRAAGNSLANDSLYVQFDGAQNVSGAPVARIGFPEAIPVVVEEGSGTGVSGWGWNDGNHGTLAAPVYFATSGMKRVRIQQREDGVTWDQFVLTAASNATTRPGLVRGDTTILPATYGTGSGVTAQHAYGRAGVYPITVRVTDNDAASAAATTTATIASTASALVSAAGGPYTGSVNGGITFDAGSTRVPTGSTARYAWSFGDDIVLHASQLAITGSAWKKVSDASAADAVAIVNPNLGAAKFLTARSAPSSYIEGKFHAAAGVPYRVWLRMRAANDHWANDSVFVQFSGSVTSPTPTSPAAWRIGSKNALAIVLEDGRGAGVSQWGWADSGYGTLGAPVYFNQDGEQTIRIQQREDGVRIDQIVISTDAYYDAAPGLVEGDKTIVPVNAADTVGVMVQHAYRRAGVYPVVLRVTAGSMTSRDQTTATIK